MTTRVELSARQRSVGRWDRAVGLTPLHREHLASGADMVERDGWLLPRTYGDPDRERATLRDTVGILDISEQGTIDLKGEEVEALLRSALPEIGSARIGTRASGTDGVLVYRLTQEQALVMVPARAAGRTFETLCGAAGQRDCIHLTDLTGALCGLRLLGPQAPAVLQRLSALDLALNCFADGAFAQGAVAKIHTLVARRDGGGLVGYDLYVDRDLASYLWETLLEVGAPLGLLPVGRETEEALG